MCCFRIGFWFWFWFWSWFFTRCLASLPLSCSYPVGGCCQIRSWSTSRANVNGSFLFSVAVLCFAVYSLSVFLLHLGSFLFRINGSKMPSPSTFFSLCMNEPLELCNQAFYILKFPSSDQYAKCFEIFCHSCRADRSTVCSEPKFVLTRTRARMSGSGFASPHDV